MNEHYPNASRFVAPFLATFFFWIIACPAAFSCGYNWISDCSSQVHLRINGTLDSFQIAPCPYGYSFDGMYLGNLQSITLATARAITWESCQNNVSGIQLFYRVYEQGMSGGGWSTLDMQQDYFKVEGAYTTRYRSLPAETPLNNLIIGKTYTLEVYFVAQVDTVGDDFIPETTLLRNNNGLNYKLSFTYGGATAPPFLLVPHLTSPACNGGSDGKVSISVYGDHNGIFYHWSNNNINFYELNNVPAGPYSLTVTNAAGAAVSTAVQLSQPLPVQVNFSDIQAIGCSNSPGAATAQASGGTANYQYHWSNGQNTASAVFPASGTYVVTVSDAHNCSATASVVIANNGLIEENINASICSGASYIAGNQSFTASGNYSINIPGNGGCDTLVHLNLSVQNPAFLLQNLPVNAILTCTAPSLDLCANSSADATYLWSHDGLMQSANPCLPVNQGGVYSIQCTIGNCSAAKTIPVEAHLEAMPDTIFGQYTLNCLAPAPAWLVCHTQAQTPVFSWNYDNQVLSVTDSCLFTITGFQNGMFVLPQLSVTDRFGCQNSNPVQAITVVQDTNIPDFFLTSNNATNPEADNGMISISGLDNPDRYNISWSTGDTSIIINQLSPGVYCATVTGQNGCSTTDCAEVVLQLSTAEPALAALKLIPNPVSAGNNLAVSIHAQVAAGTYSWAIYSAAGHLELSGDENFIPAKGQFSIRIPEALPSGMYFIQLRNPASVFQSKILVNGQ